MELIERIELSLPGYDAGVLPLNYISMVPAVRLELTLYGV